MSDSFKHLPINAVLARLLNACVFPAARVIARLALYWINTTLFLEARDIKPDKAPGPPCANPASACE